MFIRPAAQMDISELVRLRKLQLLDEGAIPDCDLSKELESFYTKAMEENWFLAWFAENEQKEILAVIGICYYQVVPHYGNPSGKIAQITNMYTVPTHRRQGIGTKMLMLAFEEAQHHGYQCFRVNASKDGKWLYQSFGFDESNYFMELNAN